MERSELIELVKNIAECNGTEEEVDQWIFMLEANVPHPAVTDLIFYSEVELTPEEVVDKALAYKPIQL